MDRADTDARPARRRAPLRAATSDHPPATEDLLRPGEHLVAAASGTDPSAANAVKVAGVLGGALGVVLIHLVRKARREDGAPSGEPRQVVLTDQRVLVVEAGSVVAEAPVSAVTKVGTKKAYSSFLRRVVTIDTTAGPPTRVEGERDEVDELARQVTAGAGLRADQVRSEGPFWLLRVFPVALLFVFGVSAVLISIPEVGDAGVGAAVIMFLIGAALIAGGFALRRRLLR